MAIGPSAPHPGDAPPLMGPYGDGSDCLLGDAIGFLGVGGVATGLKMRYD